MAQNPARDSSGDPDDALRRPSALIQAEAPQLRALAERGEPTRDALRAVAADPSAAAHDRVSAAVLLDALLQDAQPLEALSPEDAAASLDLRFSEPLRASAARALGEAATVRLLSWAAAEHPGEPPVSAAEAAAHLGLDDDGRIYGRVSQRAVLIGEQKGVSRVLKDQLRRLSDALGRADQQARGLRSAAGAEDASGTATAPGAATASSAADETASPESANAAPAADPTAPAAPKWTDDDDAALAAVLAGDQTGPGAQYAPRTADGSPAAEAPDARTSPEPAADSEPLYGEIVDDPRDPSAGAAEGGRTAGPSSSHSAPAFGDPTGAGGSGDGRPVGFGSFGGQSSAPTGGEDQTRSGAGAAGLGPSPHDNAGSESRRSYDFRYLAEDTPTPSTAEEKAELRTTLRNWGIFALGLVLVLLILIILL